ncbi:hypothetical protein SCP_1402880 [Sparassis crispa]|uniref:Uncharacterized protein n=1 Tax=Sparassis crispa TaxID=139825 RepID=A0A401H3E9_9APHY|nr:hypothetical protein SCP_1402880 [Sparassis crispa]GBE88880.1 hypothetical protein SCP_1402880 [Sparassis crispa]
MHEVEETVQMRQHGCRGAIEKADAKKTVKTKREYESHRDGPARDECDTDKIRPNLPPPFVLSTIHLVTSAARARDSGSMASGKGAM